MRSLFLGPLGVSQPWKDVRRPCCLHQSSVSRTLTGHRAPGPRVPRRGLLALTQQNALPHPAPSRGLGTFWDCWSNLVGSKGARPGRKTLGRGPEWGWPEPCGLRRWLPSCRVTVCLVFLTTSLVVLVAGQRRALRPRGASVAGTGPVSACRGLAPPRSRPVPWPVLIQLCLLLRLDVSPPLPACLVADLLKALLLGMRAQ